MIKVFLLIMLILLVYFSSIGIYEYFGRIAQIVWVVPCFFFGLLGSYSLRGR